MTRYPVYVISKGRADCCLTARVLIQDRVDFRLVIEPQEEEAYAARFPREILLVLPFANLGLGSIPARNFVWEHAKKSGAERHWILDDNIRRIARRYEAQRIGCEAGLAFRAVEDFVDRYTNIGVAGLNYWMFVPEGTRMPAFNVNVHVYSCLLIDCSLPYRWRGRYNEDTDLCLQVIAGGFCTVLVNAFVVEKMRTMTMKGGNSAELYAGDGRLVMARSLERAWPGVVTTARRFGRPQHRVNWGRLKGELKRREDLDWTEVARTSPERTAAVQQREIKSAWMQRLLDEHDGK